MGFGHRVYKNYDPRAKIMQKTCHEVLREMGIKDDPRCSTSRSNWSASPCPTSISSRRSSTPNVDFYSGITLKALGFPVAMFTVLFAVARTVGWIAQWSEMIEDPGQRIGRPRQLYVGADRRDYHADQRSAERLASTTIPARRMRTEFHFGCRTAFRRRSAFGGTSSRAICEFSTSNRRAGGTRYGN